MRKLRVLRKIEGLKKTEPSIDLVPFTDAKKETLLEGVLKSQKKVSIIQEKSFLGCSLGTIAACIGISSQTFSAWAYRGREECLKYDPEFTLTPHMKLWRFLEGGYSQARILAETSLAQRDPEKFLKSKTSQLLGDDWTEDRINPEEEESKSKLDIGTHFIASLQLARKQGLDLNDLIDRNLLSVKTDPPKEKKEETKLVNGLIATNLFPSLPESISKNLET